MTEVNECFSRFISLLNQEYTENGILIVAGVVWGFEDLRGGCLVFGVFCWFFLV